MQPEREPTGRGGLRGLVLGIVLLPLNAYWVVTVEAVQFGPYVTTLSLLPNVLCWLFFLALGNRLLARIAPRRALRSADLVVAYTLLAVGSAIAGCDQLQILMHYIGHAAFVERSQPGASDAWRPFLPDGLVLSDPAAVEAYYEGNASLYTAGHARAWLRPLAGWLTFIALLAGAMAASNALLRRRWIEEEKLPFPLVQLPLAMVESRGHLWRQPLLWLGFALAGGIDLYNGIAYLAPSLPMVPTYWVDISPLFTEKPWSALGWTTVSLYPMVIGIGYLLPLDLLFSCWFFFLLWKLQPVVTFAAGWDITTEFPYVKQQGYGAAMAVGGFALAKARRALGRQDRGALAVLSVCVAGLVAFVAWAGLAWWWALAFVALLLVSLLAVTRMRAEFGAPVHDLINAAPELALVEPLGSQPFSARDLTAMSLFYWVTKLHRSDPMPLGLEAVKLGGGVGLSPRPLLWLFPLAMVLGAVAGFWAMLHQGYALGNAARWSFPAYAGWETFNRLGNWLEGKPANPGMGVAMAVGATLCAGLFILRNIWVACPFHPVALAISSTFQMNLVWLPLLIAWVCKALTLQWGGRHQYVRWLPFFLGLVLGQSVVGSLWSLVSVVTGERMYSFWGY